MPRDVIVNVLHEWRCRCRECGRPWPTLAWRWSRRLRPCPFCGSDDVDVRQIA